MMTLVISFVAILRLFCLYFLNPDVCMHKNECYLYLYMSYIFLSENILKPYMEIFLFSMG